MTQARSTMVSLDDTPWYHCVNRCVRRAFLCGEDPVSGRDYSHQRGWIAERIRQLAGVFAIDIAAYAVMSNHFHIVLRVDRQRAQAWSLDEVLERWTQLFAGPPLVARYRTNGGEGMSQTDRDRLNTLAEQYRERLYDLSWFMRCLNESIARQANAEDGVKGRFWEGRFKSQALLDEAAVLAAMTYVDLNPIRAGLAETPEGSDHTALQARIQDAQDPQTQPRKTEPKPRIPATTTVTENQLPAAPLMPFDATARSDWAIPFAFDDYLQLVDWTGRALHPRKRGYIPDNQPKILARLGIAPEYFIRIASRSMLGFGAAIGRPAELIDLAARRQQRFLRGVGQARRAFGERAEAV